MKREFTYAWAALAIYIAAAEFVGPVLDLDTDILRVIGAVWFALFEAWAIGRPKRGDTLSEHLWLAYAGKLGRIPLIVGFCLYVAFALVSIPAESEIMLFGLPAAPLALVVGTVGWLVPHLLVYRRSR